MKKNEAKLNVSISIIGIVILEGIALMKGIDGLIFTGVIAAISALGGHQVGKLFKK